MQKIEVKSYKMKSWEAFSSWNYVLHFFLNFFTDFFYFWYGTPNRYWDYLCEISSSYFGWFGRYLAWGRTLSGLVWRWPWFHVLISFFILSQKIAFLSSVKMIRPDYPVFHTLIKTFVYQMKNEMKLKKMVCKYCLKSTAY